MPRAQETGRVGCGISHWWELGSSAVDVRDNINASNMYMSTASGIIRPRHFGIVSSEKSE
jgi:hypothetical protein